MIRVETSDVLSVKKFQTVKVNLTIVQFWSGDLAIAVSYNKASTESCSVSSEIIDL